MSANQHFASTFSRRSFRLSFLFPLRCQSAPENSLAGYFSTDIDTRFLLGAKCWIRGGEGTWAVTPNRKVNHSVFLILQKVSTLILRQFILHFMVLWITWREIMPRLYGEKLPWSSSRVTLPAELTLVTAGSQLCSRMLWLSRLDRVGRLGEPKCLYGEKLARLAGCSHYIYHKGWPA